jgi:malate dehydrogenase (oxaloacetate-decarboxylating)
MDEIKVVVNGVGAAGVACSKIVMAAGVQKHRRLRPDGRDLRRTHGKYELGQGLVREKHQSEFGKRLDSRRYQRRGRIFRLERSGRHQRNDDLKNMAKDPIIFAMANPVPEIMPEEAAGLAR